MSGASIRRFSAAFLVPFVALAGSLVGPSAASAVTQVGETFPGATGSCDTGTALQSSSPGSPPQYAAPSAGVITAWSFHATPVAPTLLKLKVARPAGGNTFTIVGESPPKSPPGGVLSTYTDVRIAVKPGDVIGFYAESASDDAECFRSAPGFGFHYGIDHPPGSTAVYIPAGLSSQMSISAVLEPSNSFTLGKPKLNKKKGTATITATLPNPGELTGSGKGVKVSTAAGAVTSKPVVAPGQVKLKIKAKGKKKRKLKKTGKARVKVKITYTPTGGDPATRSKRLKLKKR